MKIYNQWNGLRTAKFWSIAPFVLFRTEHFLGVVLFGIVFEFPLTAEGREFHKTAKGTNLRW